MMLKISYNETHKAWLPEYRGYILDVAENNLGGKKSWKKFLGYPH